MDLSHLFIAISAALVSGAGTWFSVARKFVHRDEVEKMIDERMKPLNEKQANQQSILERISADVAALRVETGKLTVLMEFKQPSRRGNSR